MRRAADISCLEALPCPTCGESLERGQGRQGLVWLCRNCFAGAVTLPILRRHAPRPFVNRVWQDALHDGHDSGLVCPACTQNFIAVGHPAVAQILVCVRCYWVWLASDVLASLATLVAPPALPPPGRHVRRRLTAGAREARR